MSDLQSIVASSLDYHLTWCERHYAQRYVCDWRVDPCLVIVCNAGQPYRLQVRNGEEQRSFEASDGEALLVPAGVTHRFEADACEIRGINVQYSLFGSIDVLSFFRVPHHLTAVQAEDVRHTIDSLVDLIGRRSQLYPVEEVQRGNQLNLPVIARERQYAFELLALILEFSEVLPQGQKRLILLQKLKPVLEHIEDNLEKKVGIEALAEICGYSAHRFSSVFKEITGSSPHQYILNRRMEKAMSLLSHSELSVGEIAERLGFHDQPHFTKLFKIATGLSPTYYRKDILRRFAREIDSDFAY